jgi:NAD(P)-dependent dehydrogenase (short-subunit alcohol dehydrogenase family)/acyl carrier protein
MDNQARPDSSALENALKVTQESLAAFQKLQEQTAQLHQQFLQTQESAQKTLQTLVEGQQRIVAASLGMPLPPAVSPTPPTPLAHLPQAIVKPVEQETALPAQYTPVSMASPTRDPLSRLGGSGDGREGISTTNASTIEAILIDVVAEKTGYPPDMLSLDMGLDSDLGIDSIKRVEILSALQEKLPDAPVVKPEHLGTLTTLRQIADFLSNVSPPVERRETGAPPASFDRVQKFLIEIVAEKTGYPPEMLGLDMGLDSDLGIDSIKRVEILSAIQEKLPDAPFVKPEHLGTLTTLRQIADFLSSVSPPIERRETGAAMPALQRHVLQAVSAPPACVSDDRNLWPTGAAVWLVADDSPLSAGLDSQLQQQGAQPQTFNWNREPPEAPLNLAGLLLLAPAHRPDTARRALRWLQRAGRSLRNTRGQLVSITQLDGSFGLSPSGPGGDPTVGALAGLVKTAGLEWPEISCKAIDLGPDVPTQAIVEELCCNGPLEVGLSAAIRTTLELVPHPLAAAGPPPFSPRDVVLMTGGARGVTAEAAVELAPSGATLVLIGRSQHSHSESPDIAVCNDEAALKRAIALRGGLTPKQIDADVKVVLARREIQRTLERIAAAGGRAIYRSADVRNSAELTAVVNEIRELAGPITAIIHGAGVLADRRIEDLTPEQFDAVYETKVTGVENLLAATSDDPIRTLALFSSSTGRFGRIGQAAYAAANEALNKLAQREARRRPNCRVVSINWGPWAGGMVNAGLERLFASEGIALIPLADGARHLAAELAASPAVVEVVVTAPSGIRSQESGVRSQESGVARHSPRATRHSPLVAMTRVFERPLDLERAPILRAHVIDGRAVVPLALTMEWLAHAALHAHPGLTFLGCDGLRPFNPLVVSEGRATSIIAVAGKSVIENSLYRVPVEIRGQRTDGREVTFSRADMLLATESPRGESRLNELRLPPTSLDPDDVYQLLLFHGPELRGIEQFVGCGADGIVVTAHSAPVPTQWIDQPLRGQWLADPLVLDCAFQAMSVWCHTQHGAVSLPSAVGAYRQFRRFSKESVTICCRVTGRHGQIVSAEIEFHDVRGLIARIDGFECVLDLSLNQAFRKNQLESALT